MCFYNSFTIQQKKKKKKKKKRERDLPYYLWIHTFFIFI